MNSLIHFSSPLVTSTKKSNPFFTFSPNQDEKGRKNFSVTYTDPANNNNRSLESVMNKYKIVVDEMQQELEEIHAKKLSAEEKLLRSERETEEALITLKEKNFEIAKLKEENANMKKKCLDLKETNIELEDKLANLQTHEGIFEKIKLGYNKISRENKRLEDQLREKDGLIASQETMEKEWERTLEMVKEKQNSLERENRELNNLVKRLRNEDMGRKFSNYQTGDALISGPFKEKALLNSSSKTKYSELQREINNFNMENRIKELEEILSDCNRKYENSENIINKLKQENLSLQREKSNLIDKFEEAMLALKDKDSYFDSLGKELFTTKKQMETLIADKNQDLDNYVSKKSKEGVDRRKMSELTEENNKLRVKINMCHDELKSIKEEMKSMTQDYEQELLQNRVVLDAKDKEIKTLQIKIKLKEDEIMNLRSHIDRYCSVTSSQSLDISHSGVNHFIDAKTAQEIMETNRKSDFKAPNFILDGDLVNYNSKSSENKVLPHLLTQQIEGRKSPYNRSPIGGEKSYDAGYRGGETSEGDDKSVTEFRIPYKKASPGNNPKMAQNITEEFARKAQISFKRERAFNEEAPKSMEKSGRSGPFLKESDGKGNKKDNIGLSSSRNATEGSIHSKFIEKFNKIQGRIDSKLEIMSSERKFFKGKI